MASSCISCHKRVTNTTATTVFKCPQCQNYDIMRCGPCRENAVSYSCPACGFMGPN
ncbi:RNA-binding protein [Candidatus Woesearchaeota archaeon]|nr:RNA-binding protein [Candidatus Woesearchaeota archaeon]